MKKILALVLAMMLAMSMLTGCASGVSGAAEGTAEEKTGTEKQNSDNPPAYRIGCILYGKEDSLGSTCYSLLNKAAEALGCEMVYAMGSYEATAQIADAENLIASGVDGLLVLPLAETASQKIGSICEANGIPWAIMFRTVMDESIRKELDSSTTFVGNILGDDVGNAKEMVRIISEEYGIKKICTLYSQEGSSSALRNDGFKEGISEYNVEQLSESTPQGGDMSSISGTIQTFITTNPSVEGILSTSGSAGLGEVIASTIDQVAPANVKFAVLDTFSGMEECFKSGRLAAVCGGQAPISLFTFIMLYNRIDGTPLSDTPMELQQKYIFVKDAQECELFNKYIVNPEYELFSAEQIRQMTTRYNPSFTKEGLEKAMEDCNFENLTKGLQ